MRPTRVGRLPYVTSRPAIPGRAEGSRHLHRPFLSGARLCAATPARSWRFPCHLPRGVL